MVVGLLVVGVLPVEAGGRDGIALLTPGLTTGGRLVLGGAPGLPGLPRLLGLLAGRLLLPLKAGLPPLEIGAPGLGLEGLGLFAGRALL